MNPDTRQEVSGIGKKVGWFVLIATLVGLVIAVTVLAIVQVQIIETLSELERR